MLILRASHPLLRNRPGEAPPAILRRADLWRACAIFAVLLGVYLSTATYTIAQVNDSRASALSAWSLGTRGTLTLPTEWPTDTSDFWMVEGREDRVFTNRFPGPSLWAAPFYAVAHQLDGRPTPDHPMLVDYGPAAIAAATAAALAVALTYLLLRTVADRRTAVLGALLLGTGTGVWSVSADALWTHGLTHLWLVLGLLGVVHGRATAGGLSFALGVLTRPHTAVIPAIVGLGEAWHQRTIRPAIVLGLSSFLGVVGMVAYSYCAFGTWKPIAGYGDYALSNLAGRPMSAFLYGVAGTLFDRARGLVFYAPIVFVLAPGLRAGWRAAPAWVRLAAVSGIVYMLVQLRVNAFAGGTNFFGSRLTIEMLVLIAPLLAVTWEVWARRSGLLRMVVALTAAYMIVLHALGAAMPSLSRQGVADEWRANISEYCAQDPEPVGCQDVRLP